VSKVPTEKTLAWVAAGSFMSGAALAALVMLFFVH